jgi:hypothetical protein
MPEQPLHWRAFALLLSQKRRMAYGEIEILDLPGLRAAAQ